MSYTVKQLADLSGVSARTLHWYDKTGLLKPAYLGANGYRYYEEEQLLLLQQILFFRELGFNLNDIQNLLYCTDFDKVKSLRAHRQILNDNARRMHKLMNTIDKTISHLRGNNDMNDKDLYHGFDKKKQAEYEAYLVKYHGTVAEDLIGECASRMKKWSKADLAQIKKDGDQIYEELAQCIAQALSPRSDEVQLIIQKHFLMTGKFYTVTNEVYGALAQMYCEHADFRAYFDVFDPKLADFIAEAMRVYIQKM